MNSIKTFWSPELKKERALRKDEATKIGVWKEQYRVVQEETQVRRFLCSAGSNKEFESPCKKSTD